MQFMRSYKKAAVLLQWFLGYLQNARASLPGTAKAGPTHLPLHGRGTRWEKLPVPPAMSGT